MKLTTALLAATLLIGCKANVSDTVPSADLEAMPGVATTPPPAFAMVAAANPLAAQAGADILAQGGSAVDAAVAVQAVLGLVEPQSSGLGGGAFMVVYDPKTAKVWTYDGREAAPSGADAKMFLDSETGKPVRYFDGIASGRSTGVPGAVAMLGMAHQDYGQLDWATSFEPAIKHAEEGFVVSPRMANLTARMGRFYLKNDPEAKAYFYLPDESTIPEGYLRDNQPYADTLRAIQSDPRALLKGPIGEAIIAKTRIEPLAGTLSLADMARYTPIKREAICSTYRDHTLCGAPPPASGPVAVSMILGMLENFDMAPMKGLSSGWHVFADASFLAYADRDKYIADADFVDVPVKELLSKDYLKSRAALIQTDAVNTNRTAGNPVAYARGQDATPDSPGTSHFTVVDKDGLVVSMTTTVEAPFGSQRMVGGFMLNNQLTDFSFRDVDDAGNPIANAVAPGKRPRSSMAPMIVFDPEGQFLFTTGSPGGNSIIAYTAKSIVGLIDWGLTPQQAVELPNVIARNGTVSLESQNLKDAETNEIDRGAGAVEFGLDEDTVSALENLGHTVRRSKGEISGLHIIYRNADGTLTGGADPRREGVALRVD